MLKTKLKVREKKLKPKQIKRLTLGQIKVLRFLKDHIRHTKREIAEGTGLLSLKSVRYYLKALRDKGYVIAPTNKGVCLLGEGKNITYLEDASGAIDQCLSNIGGALDIGNLMKDPLLIQIKFFKLELSEKELIKLTKKVTEMGYLLVAGQTQKAIGA